MNAPGPEQAEWLGDLPPDAMRRIIDALYRVHGLLSVITDHAALLERIMEESKQVADAEACSLILYDKASDELYFQVALGESGNPAALKETVRLRLGQGIAGQAALTRQSILSNDARNDTRFYREADAKTNFETRSVIAAPLVDRDNLVGVLEVINKSGGGVFTEADLRVMEMFASLAAAAIENARLIDETVKAARLAAIGQAVAGLSHYTKNLVAGLSGSVDLIDQGLQTNNFEFLEKSWPIFKRSTRRVSNFVEDMMAYSKERRPHRRECDLNELLHEVAGSFWGLLMRRKVELETDAGTVTQPIRIDPVGMHRCLLNLVMNAADAVPKEGGRIRISGTMENGRLLLQVMDNGCGVPEENRQRIFEPFFSTKGAQGTGLGLAVTRKIVLEHEGSIDVIDAPGGGALFRIALPLAAGGGTE